MKTRLQAFAITLLIITAAADAAEQTPPKGDASGGSAGIVTPSMSPPPQSPTLQNKPKTPTQDIADGSVRHKGLPAVLVYTATLKRVEERLSPRLGGWSCEGKRCTLKTTGTLSRAKTLQACRGLQQLAEERGVKVGVETFEANQKVRLTTEDLRECVR